MLVSYHPDILLQLVSTSEASDSELHNDEKLIANSIRSEKARQHFIAGRVAARRSLLHLGIESTFAILRSADNSPIWPAGIVGSIAHSSGTAVAALARKDKFNALGVDLEPRSRAVVAAAERRILVGCEKTWVHEIVAERKLRLLAIFSAKEAIYKALSPLGSGIFYFSNVETTLHKRNKQALFSFDTKIENAILAKCGLNSAPYVDVITCGEFLLSIAICKQ